MKDLRAIRDFIDQHRTREPLVLCTLVRKSGSSYRGVGAKKIVSAESSLGLISGGCLEASIEKTARQRRAELPFVESFSTLADEDRLLGYQTGCQGVIDILFEEASAQDLDLLVPYGEKTRFPFVRVSLAPESLGQRSPAECAVKDAGAIYEPWVEPVRLYIIGCGADADVFGPLAETLGWTAHFLDYRASLMTEGRFAPHAARTLGLSQFAAYVPAGARVAVVLMTHNYEADLEILRVLKNHRFGYLGCLGPAARLQSLRRDLLALHGETLGFDLLAVSHAPAGIFPHGQSAEEIAFSITAQIQDELIEKTKQKKWTIVLAAGASSRFGGVKARAKIDGVTLLDRALTTARAVSGENVLLVTGAHELSGSARVAHNPDWARGMGHSIAFGIRQVLDLDPKPGTILLLPVDQPLVDADHLRTLADLSLRTSRCALTSSAQVISPPAAIPPTLFAAAMNLKDDSGLKSILRPHEMICVENPTAGRDFDEQKDFDEYSHSP